MPIFDNSQHEPANDNSPEITVRHNLPNDETCTIPYRWIPQCFPPQMKQVTEPIRITTMSLMRMQVRSSSALPILIPAAQNMISTTILNRIVMRTTDIKLQICLSMVPGTTTYNLRRIWKSTTEGYGALTYLPKKLLVSLLGKHRITRYLVLAIFNLQKLKPHIPAIPTLCILVCPTEHFRRHSQKFLKLWLRIKYGVHKSYP